jgi:hypothetical protein
MNTNLSYSNLSQFYFVTHLVTLVDWLIRFVVLQSSLLLLHYKFFSEILGFCKKKKKKVKSKNRSRELSRPIFKRVVQMDSFGSRLCGGGCLLLDLVQAAWGTDWYIIWTVDTLF